MSPEDKSQIEADIAEKEKYERRRLWELIMRNFGDVVGSVPGTLTVGEIKEKLSEWIKLDFEESKRPKSQSEMGETENERALWNFRGINANRELSEFDHHLRRLAQDDSETMDALKARLLG